MPMKNPPHPGDFIRTEIIEPAGLSVTAAAAALQVSRPALSSLLNSKSDLPGDMALRIEKAFGVKMDTLMRMQALRYCPDPQASEANPREAPGVGVAQRNLLKQSARSPRKSRTGTGTPPHAGKPPSQIPSLQTHTPATTNCSAANGNS